MRRIALLALLGFWGCLPEPTLPRCDVVTECPPCQGWRTCEDGYCFKFGTLAWDEGQCSDCGASDAVIDGDGCCPGQALNAQEDSDCGGTSVALEAAAVSLPAVVGDGFAVVYEAVAGGLYVLFGDATGTQAPVALPSDGALQTLHTPVAMGPSDVLVASSTGLCRVNNGELVWACNRGGPQTARPMVAGGRLFVGQLLVGQGGALAVLDEAAKSLGSVDLESPVTGIAGAGARYFVVTADGTVRAFELTELPPRVLWSQTFTPTTAPSAVAASTVAMGTENGRLLMLGDEGGAPTVLTHEFNGAADVELVSDGKRYTASVGGAALTVVDGLKLPLLEPIAGGEGVVGPGLFTQSSRLFVGGNGRVAAFVRGPASWSRVWEYSHPSLSGGALKMTADGTLIAPTSHGLLLLTPGAGPPAGAWSSARGTPGNTGYTAP